MPRPHKEERFLFPIYPCICFGAAFSSILLVELSVTTFQKLFIIKGSPTVATAVANKDHGHSNQLIGFKSLIVVALLWIPSMIISQTRLMALSTYYAAPLIVYSKIANVVSSTKTPANVVDTNLMICTCGEWYRFPSSFYLPMKTKFSFAPSSFTGQLPQPFTVHGSRPSAPTIFNDENLPESGSLINDFTLCDYMVDVSSSSDCLTLAGDDDQSQWSPRIKAPFLHAEQTTNVLHRTLFIPFLHEKARERGDVRYADYVLYEKSRRQDAH
jgi:alpha-1,2-mannosyltransferase